MPPKKGVQIKCLPLNLTWELRCQTLGRVLKPNSRGNKFVSAGSVGSAKVFKNDDLSDIRSTAKTANTHSRSRFTQPSLPSALNYNGTELSFRALLRTSPIEPTPESLLKEVR